MREAADRTRIPDSSHERIFGLDVMRAAAITLVVLAHSSSLLSSTNGTSPWFPRIDGVDLFFVLSGFLVGGMLLRDPLRGTPGRLRHLLDFWQRRWLRTLPNYFVFLAINILLVRWAVAPGLISQTTLAYAVFMQNFHVPLDLFFWESWSLAVEEWFYLLFPLLLAGLVALARLPARRAYLVTALVFCTLPIVTRMEALHQVASAAEVDLFVRKLVITRLDAIGMGALAAWVMVAFPRFWQRSRWPLCMLGLVSLCVVSNHRPDPSAVVSTALYFTLVPVTIACLLPLLSNWRSVYRAGRPFVFVSKSAYALYLVHMPMLYLFQYGAAGLPAPSVLLAFCYWLACLLVSFVVLHTIELPFMRMRDRLSLRIRGAAQPPLTPP